MLGGDDVGESGEMEIWGFGISGEEGEPLVGDDEGDENVGVFAREELAEVDESVDVAPAGVGKCGEVGELRRFGNGGIHC